MAERHGERVFLTYDEAVALLPEGDTIHTLLNPNGGMLIGTPREGEGLTIASALVGRWVIVEWTHHDCEWRHFTVEALSDGWILLRGRTGPDGPHEGDAFAVPLADLSMIRLDESPHEIAKAMAR